jgi:hypothetical protein
MYKQMIKIDKDIPIPGLHLRSDETEAVGRLDIGDSILFDRDFTTQGVRSLIRCHHSSDKKFAIRTVEAGVRCWRIK